MTIVRTVLGDIAPEALGIAAAHEHLWCDQGLCREPAFPRRYERMRLRDEDLVVAELAPFHAAGGRAVIEVTVRGWGRDMSRLASISRRAQVHVVATSGFYVENCLPCFAASADIGALEAALLDELTKGADGSAIRTGLLKAAVSRAVLEGVEERCTRAVARVQRQTGLAITTHTSASARFQIPGGNAGTQFLDLFEAEGVDPSRVIIGHCDENADARQLSALMRRGAYVAFDVIGKLHWMRDETRVELLTTLLNRGHADRLLLSSDCNRISELHVLGGCGYDHVLARFVPMLRAAGADEACLRRMLVTNPATIFAFDPKGVLQ